MNGCVKCFLHLLTLMSWEQLFVAPTLSVVYVFVS